MVVVVVFSCAGVVGDPSNDEPSKRVARWREIFVMRQAQARRLHVDREDLVVESCQVSEDIGIAVGDDGVA